MNERVPMEVNLRQAWTYWHLEKLEAHERPQTPRERDALYAAWDAEFDAWLAVVRTGATWADHPTPEQIANIIAGLQHAADWAEAEEYDEIWRGIHLITALIAQLQQARSFQTDELPDEYAYLDDGLYWQISDPVAFKLDHPQLYTRKAFRLHTPWQPFEDAEGGE